MFTQRDYAEAVQALQRTLAIDPWQEQTHRNLMIAYSRTGNFNAALAQYNDCRQILKHELGIDPDPETTALYERIQATRQTSPQWLPQPATPFIGRHTESALISENLSNPACRILTIVGMGGTGKSRLALAIASQANQEHNLQFLSGVAYISLAGIKENNLIVTTIANALNLSLVGSANSKNQLFNYLKNHEMLLVLDNLENVETSQSLLTELAAKCPQLKILITSREPLTLIENCRLNLDGLSYPSTNTTVQQPHQAMEYDAVRLFVQSAKQFRPNFTLETADVPHLIRLCQILSGVPLALQLAAAWLRVMSLRDIFIEIQQNLDLLSSRLRDIPQRQQSMNIVFEHTWTLLSETEQAAFQAISVFEGGFSHEASQEVLEIEPQNLSSLIERGLLITTDSQAKRFSAHELSRRFAAEKLAQSNQYAPTLTRHSRHYLKLLEANENNLYGENPQKTLSTLLPDLQNIRRAWQWAVTQANYQLLSSSAEGLKILFDLPGLYEEALRLLNMATKQLRKEKTSSQIKSLQATLCQLTLKEAFFHLRRGNHHQAYTLTTGALELAENLNQPQYVAEANNLLGDISKRLPLEKTTETYYLLAERDYLASGEIRALAANYNSLGWFFIHDDPERALDYFQKAYKGHSEEGNKLGMAVSSGSIASIQFDKGNTTEALHQLKESHKLFKEGGYLGGVSSTANNLGIFQHVLGRYNEALSFFNLSLEIKNRLGQLSQRFLTLSHIGVVHIELGDYQTAGQYLEEALHFYEENSPQFPLLVTLWEQAHLFIRTGQFELAETNLKRVREIAQNDSPGQLRTLAISTSLLGLLHKYRKENDRALAYFEEATSYFQDYRNPIDEARYALLPMASLLVEQGKLDTAETLLAKIRPLQERLNKNPIVLEMNILQARIEHARGHTHTARKILADIIPNEERPSDPAAIQYEQWRLTQSKTNAQKALSLYEKLVTTSPNIIFLQRVNELEKFLQST